MGRASTCAVIFGYGEVSCSLGKAGSAERPGLVAMLQVHIASRPCVRTRCRQVGILQASASARI